jgi:hypothetical protein
MLRPPKRSEGGLKVNREADWESIVWGGMQADGLNDDVQFPMSNVEGGVGVSVETDCREYCLELRAGKVRGSVRVRARVVCVRRGRAVCNLKGFVGHEVPKNHKAHDVCYGKT